MSKQVSNVFVDQFESEVHRAYQGQKTLRETVRVKTGVVGKSTSFPKSGKGVATKAISQNEVIAMNLSYAPVAVTLTDWNADDYSSIFDQAKVNFSEIQELSFNTASAIARREDQIVIDAMEAGASLTEGGDAVVFNVALLGKLAKTLNENNVPDEDRYLVWSPGHQEALLNTTQATSTDFNSVQALVKGGIDSFYGFSFKKIGNREEGGLTKPIATSQRFFAYHKKAVGLAIGIDMKSDINYIPTRKSYLVSCSFSAGAVVIDAEGIIKGTAAIA